MSDLTDFLLACIADDEAVARAAIDPDRPGVLWQWVRTVDDMVVESSTREDTSVSLRTVEEFPTTSGVGDLPAFVLDHVEVSEWRALQHIARHDPARVLAECEAKRRIIEFHRYNHECSSIHYGEEDNCAWILESEDCSTVRLLGLPYADRPGYREEWKP